MNADTIKDIVIPISTFIAGLLIEFLWEQHKSKNEQLQRIENYLTELIEAAESGSIYGAKFRFNLVYQETTEFCEKHHLGINIDTELSNLSIACTSQHRSINLDLAEIASSSLITKIKKATIHPWAA